MREPSFSLLSELWLSEPGGDLIARAESEAGLPPAPPAELAPAYFDLFLAGVYPYGTVFLDPSGELNGALALWTERRFAAAGYAAAASVGVGAPDHVGLCLGFLDHLDRRGRPDAELSALVRRWIPVCALAAEREPSAHPFYRELARATRHRLLSAAPSRHGHATLPAVSAQPEAEDGERTLGDVVRFLLAPARCGFFLSRRRLGELGREARLELSFGSRFELARRLFETAGSEGAVDRLIELLAREAGEWEEAYRRTAAEHPAWSCDAAEWLARLDSSRALFDEMRGIVESPPEWEYGEHTLGRDDRATDP